MNQKKRSVTRSRPAATLMVMGLLGAGLVFMPGPASAATGTVEIRVSDMGGSQLYFWSTSVDLASSYPRFSVGTIGRSDPGSGEGQVAIDNLVITKGDGSTQNYDFSSAPSILESSQGSTVTALRHDAGGQRLLGIGNSANKCPENYQSIAIDGTVTKATFEFQRLTGAVGDGSFWDLFMGLMPSDNEGFLSGCLFDNLIGIQLAGDGDDVRRFLMGIADGNRDSNSFTYSSKTPYKVEIKLPSVAKPACSDGIDNDGDGKVDLADPGCSGASDTDETDSGCLPPIPSNAAPTVQFDGANGMGAAADYGWAGYPYNFKASATDPNGDPVTITWKWGDGQTSTGTSGTHTYAAAGPKTITLTAKDNPSSRNKVDCPPLEALTSSPVTITFNVIEEWAVELVHPEDGSSCVQNTDLPAFFVNIMAGSCRLEAEVDTSGAPANLVAEVCFRVDDEDYKCDNRAAYSQNYNSLDHSLGNHEMAACATAKNDVHGLEFCSDPYEYLNIGLL